MRLLILFDILSPAAQGGVERRNDELARAPPAVATAARLRDLRPDVRVIPCGLEVDNVVASGRHEPERLATTIAFAGRLQDNKRVDLLLHAVARMPRPGLLLSVFGDGPERARLEQRQRTRFRRESGVLWPGCDEP